ncbi:PQQ-dependent sugar dehydrogenase [Herbidospora sp. RD11066]
MRALTGSLLLLVTGALITGSVMVPVSTASTSTPEKRTTPYVKGIRYEAETAVISRGVVQKRLRGFTGRGYVNGADRRGNFVEWTVTPLGAGPNRIHIRYQSTRTLRADLVVNDEVVAEDVRFPGSRFWRTLTFRADLPEGESSVKVVATTRRGNPHLDSVSLFPLTTPPETPAPSAEPTPTEEPTAEPTPTPCVSPALAYGETPPDSAPTPPDVGCVIPDPCPTWTPEPTPSVPPSVPPSDTPSETPSETPSTLPDVAAQTQTEETPGPLPTPSESVPPVPEPTPTVTCSPPPPCDLEVIPLTEPVPGFPEDTTPTPSEVPSTPVPTPTPSSGPGTPEPTPSLTVTPEPTPTCTPPPPCPVLPSETPTAETLTTPEPEPVVTVTVTVTPTAGTTPEPTPTPSETPSETPTVSETPTPSFSPTVEPTPTPTCTTPPVETPPATPTVEPTVDPTVEPTVSETPTAEPTVSETPTTEPTVSETPTAEPSPTPTPTTPGAPGAPTVVSQQWTVPWDVTWAPGVEFALVTERDSFKVFRVNKDGAKAEAGAVPESMGTGGEGGLMGAAFSPGWNGTTDKDVFFMHSASDGNRVAKMEYDGTTLSAYTPILTGIKKSKYHNGGRLKFGPDGFLYVSTGDAQETSLSQDPNSLNGKILRIDKTGAAAPGNPNDSRVYSLGHRNAQGLAWDSAGRLWSAELGASSTDELNLIEPGKNYGWPKCEGACDEPGMTNPKKTWSTADASPSGIAIVDDVVYMAALRGKRLYAIALTGTEAGDPVAHYVNTYGRLRAVEKVPDEQAIWITTSNTDDNGGQPDGADRIIKVSLNS